MKGFSGASRRGAASREAILQAAVRVIGREGLAGASLATVAGEAATSKPAVLYHFGSRDRLLHEVASLAFGFYRRLLPRKRCAVAAARAHGSGDRGNLRAREPQPARVRARADRPGHARPAVGELLARSFDETLQGPIRALQHLGPEEARALARALVMTIHGHVDLWLCADQADTKQFIESATRAALALVPER